MRTRPAEPRPARGRATAADVDLHVAHRKRRLALGLTQQELAELIGSTAERVHKYETGGSRVTAGQLHGIAGALEVGVAYLYEEVGTGPPPAPLAGSRQHLLLELARDFSRMPDPRHQRMVRDLARALAGAEAMGPSTTKRGRSPPHRLRPDSDSSHRFSVTDLLLLCHE
jgi:transcriptional regulator with XRE-family HTH domain